MDIETKIQDLYQEMGEVLESRELEVISQKSRSLAKFLALYVGMLDEYIRTCRGGHNKEYYKGAHKTEDKMKYFFSPVALTKKAKEWGHMKVNYQTSRYFASGYILLDKIANLWDRAFQLSYALKK